MSKNQTGIKSHVLVAAGKGGVGKSTVAVNLAIGLQRLGASVGLLDADVHGPSIPMMLGAGDRRPTTVNDRIEPIEAHGLKCMSMGFLVDPGRPVVWRGPMLAQALTQLMRDVEWGDLDCLVMDLPPGTGDVPLTVAQKVEGAMAVLVTTPQDVALADVRRAKAMLEKVEIPVVGIIENMSYLVCPHCNEEVDVFDRGGGERAASEMKIRFMGAIPLHPKVREAGDIGIPSLVSDPNGAEGQAFLKIAQRLTEELTARMEEAASSRRHDLRVIQ